MGLPSCPFMPHSPPSTCPLDPGLLRAQGPQGLGVPSYAGAIFLGSYLWTISQGGPACSGLFLLSDEHTLPILPLFSWHCRLLTTFSQYHILVLTLGVRTKLLSLSVSLILKTEADQDTSDE